MSHPARRRLSQVRNALAEYDDRFGDWLGIAVRARLQCLADGRDPPPDDAILADHWGMSRAEAARRIERLTRRPDPISDPDDPDRAARLSEVDAPIRPDGTDPPIP